MCVCWDALAVEKHWRTLYEIIIEFNMWLTIVNRKGWEMDLGRWGGGTRVWEEWEEVLIGEDPGSGVGGGWWSVGGGGRGGDCVWVCMGDSPHIGMTQGWG